MEFNKEHAEQIRDNLIFFHGKWSANAVVRVAMAYDIGMRREDALARIREWLGSGSKKAGRPTQNSLWEPIREPITEPIMEPIREPISRQSHKGIVYISSWLRHSGFSVTSFPTNPLDAGAREEKRPEWVLNLAADFKPLHGRELREFSREDRHVLGRVFALLFANFRVDERANSQKGGRFAAQIARMARASRFEQMTGTEFVRVSIRSWKINGTKPLHSVWDIEAGL